MTLLTLQMVRHGTAGEEPAIVILPRSVDEELLVARNADIQAVEAGLSLVTLKRFPADWAKHNGSHTFNSFEMNPFTCVERL
jgi:hypothetical protein